MSITNDITNRQQSIKLHTIGHAIVLGVGGIGSWVALDLALSGMVSKLYLVDPDIVEPSNLNRTPFRIADINESKVAALKYLIIERRSQDVEIFMTRTSDALADEIYSSIQKTDSYTYKDINRYQNQIRNLDVIIDCRDDVYTDFYKLPFKYYKVGYDGMSCTIDGNPRETAVWGQANGYRFTPSFVCSAQLIANLVVTDVLTVKDEDVPMNMVDEIVKTPFDRCGRLNKAITFDASDIVETMYNVQHKPKVTSG